MFSLALTIYQHCSVKRLTRTASGHPGHCCLPIGYYYFFPLSCQTHYAACARTDGL